MRSTPPRIDFRTLRIFYGDAGARQRFEELISQLVRVRHPEVRRLDDRSGDWGLEVFVGDLDGVVAVWQSKYFIDGVGATQQGQIRGALKSAITKANANGYEVMAWTLCIPVLMTPATAKWWDGFRKRSERSLGIRISLWDADELTAALIAPDAAGVAVHFLGEAGSQPSPRIADLPDPTMYDDALFVRQLVEARIPRLDSAKQQFFNAEILEREVGAKAVQAEVDELAVVRAEVAALWEHRFSGACSTSSDPLLPGLHERVMGDISIQYPRGSFRALPASVIHAFGVMHQEVDRGSAGWIREWEEVRDGSGT